MSIKVYNTNEFNFCELCFKYHLNIHEWQMKQTKHLKTFVDLHTQILCFLSVFFFIKRFLTDFFLLMLACSNVKVYCHTLCHREKRIFGVF